MSGGSGKAPDKTENPATVYRGAGAVKNGETVGHRQQ